MMKKICILSLIVVMAAGMLSGCASSDKKKGAANQGSGQKEEAGEPGTEAADDAAGKPEITIWVDAGNEYYVRMLAGDYYDEKQKDEEYAKSLPDVSWNLVDKSCLSPGQFRSALQKELDAGGGPDIIFMDKDSGVSPQELAESGALLEIGDATGSGKGLNLEYAAGTLEAGRLDGKQYAVPMQMNTPVLYGLKSDLQAAGLDTENGYGDLKRFLEALADAQEKTGKQIFENEAALDWMEAYCLPEAGDGETQALIDGLRENCGDGSGFFDSYEAIHGGKCLLGGCGATDHIRLAQNLSMFGRDEEVAFFNIPSCDGEVITELTCTMGVNKNTKHPEQAQEVLLEFQRFAYDGEGVSPMTKFFDVDCKGYAGFYEGSSRIGGAYARTYGLMGETIRSDLKEKWETYVYGNVTKAACAKAAAEEAGREPPQKETLTVLYSDLSHDGNGDFDKWLEDAAASFETEDVRVQLIACRDVMLFLSMHKMEEAGVAPDVALFSNSALGSFAEYCADGVKGSDVADYLDAQGGFLPEPLQAGVAAGGRTVGLPYAVEEYGAWYNKALAQRAGLPEGWAPGTPEELMEGLGKARESMGAEGAVSVLLENLRSLYCYAAPEPEKLAVEQEDGTWRTDRDAWTQTVRELAKLKESGLATYGSNDIADGVSAADAAKGLADGTYAAVWAGSGFGAVWSEKEKERLAFAPLSGVVMPDVFYISGNCGRPELAEDFWLHALRDGLYETGVAGVNKQPVTQVSDNARRVFPTEGIRDYKYGLWTDLWQTDKTAEELAEKYTLYELTEAH